MQGSLSNVYAAPYLSSGNGTQFGDSTNGPDATTYLTTGTGSITLTLPGQEIYIGLLWGSVDSYNTLTLYNGSTAVGMVTGTGVTSNADGNEGASGTFYVNITSPLTFDKVVATSTRMRSSSITSPMRRRYPNHPRSSWPSSESPVRSPTGRRDGSVPQSVISAEFG